MVRSARSELAPNGCSKHQARIGPAVSPTSYTAVRARAFRPTRFIAMNPKARSAFVGDCLASWATAADIPFPPSRVRATGLCLDEVSPGDDGRVRSASGSPPCRGALQVEGRGRGVERTGLWGSAPEFGELPGKRSALVVTSSSGGRTQRWIHRIGAEHVLGAAIREDRFDSAAACAQFVDLRCKLHTPVHRRP